jgi:hypothetical protein
MFRQFLFFQGETRNWLMRCSVIFAKNNWKIRLLLVAIIVSVNVNLVQIFELQEKLLIMYQQKLLLKFLIKILLIFSEK